MAEWLTPVRAAGMAAYLLAALSCGVAWVRTWHDRHISRLALLLGILHIAILFDIAFDWRWKLYGLLRAGAMANQWYGYRHWPQVSMLALLSALLLTGMGIARRKYASAAGALLAACGALLSIGCWSTEVISLHATDALLFHRAGPFMTVNFVWALACLMAAIGILKAAARHGSS